MAASRTTAYPEDLLGKASKLLERSHPVMALLEQLHGLRHTKLGAHLLAHLSKLPEGRCIQHGWVPEIQEDRGPEEKPSTRHLDLMWWGPGSADHRISSADDANDCAVTVSVREGTSKEEVAEALSEIRDNVDRGWDRLVGPSAHDHVPF